MSIKTERAKIQANCCRWTFFLNRKEPVIYQVSDKDELHIADSDVLCCSMTAEHNNSPELKPPHHETNMRLKTFSNVYYADP